MKISQLKRFIRLAIFLIILLISATVGFVILNKDEILQAAIEEINEKLTAEVDVKKVSVSAIDEWPKVALILEDVSIHRNDSFEHHLLESGEIVVGFNLIGIIKGDYKIEKIAIAAAELNIEYNPEGEVNYLIFKPTDSTETKEQISLQTLVLENSFINFYDFRGKKSKSFHVSTSQSNVELDFKDSEIKMSGSSSNIIHELLWSGKSYFKDLENNLTFDLTINRESGLININQGSLSSKDINLQKIRASISLKDQLDFKIETETSFSKYEAINQQLPGLLKSLNPYQLKGEFKFDGSVLGSIKNKNQINSDIKIGFRNASLVEPKRNMNFTNLEGSGIYRNNSLSVKNGVIKNLVAKGNLEEEEFSTIIRSLNLNLKVYSGNVSGVLNPTSLKSVYPSDQIQNFTGTLDYEVDFERNLQDGLLWDGEMELNDVSFFNKSLSHDFKNLEGVLIFNNDELALQSVKGFVAESDFLVSGLLVNPLNMIYSDRGSYFLSGNYFGENLNLDALLLKDSKPSATNSESIRNYTIPPNMNIDLDLTTNRLKYKKFNATKAHANISIGSQQLTAKEIKFESIQGTVEGEITLNTSDELIKCDVTSEVKSLAIDSIFYVFENFDQDFIEDRHLSGKLTAQLNSNFYLTKNLTPIYQTINSDINASVLDGELIEFEPMYRLSRFIDFNELAHLKFQELQNNITIKDSKVSIPNMDIRSNISNIKLNGWHTFDQKIEYHLKVPLKKEYKKDKDERFGAVESNEENLSNIFLKITGSTEDYKISYDQKSALINLKDGVVKEGKEFIETFRTKGKNLESTQVELDTSSYFDFDDSVFESDTTKNNN